MFFSAFFICPENRLLFAGAFFRLLHLPPAALLRFQIRHPGVRHAGEPVIPVRSECQLLRIFRMSSLFFDGTVFLLFVVVDSALPFLF
ncbi:hypothetical protein SAMN05428946_2854 [Edaphobacillus lindanitolerans]|uniref:Uncharacterized protein n=1 Tax=Edaphobacillus lindanitolerans TaxID=550447 RepID=A0A1U7PT82_9BACI|nr:hypothetical protein SAMN05428946_2854 [Edaphobacillus lindanitolerans]